MERAKAALEGVTPGPWELIGGGEYVTGVGVCVAPDDGGVTDADARFIAQAHTLMPELVAEVEKLRGACKTLGGVVEGQCRMALDASGLHHLIDEDGDGDWGLVWERLAELGTDNEQLRAIVERVRELAENPATYSGTGVVAVKPERIIAALEADR